MLTNFKMKIHEKVSGGKKTFKSQKVSTIFSLHRVKVDGDKRFIKSIVWADKWNYDFNLFKSPAKARLSQQRWAYLCVKTIRICLNGRMTSWFHRRGYDWGQNDDWIFWVISDNICSQFTIQPHCHCLRISSIVRRLFSTL